MGPLTGACPEPVTFLGTPRIPIACRSLDHPVTGLTASLYPRAHGCALMAWRWEAPSQINLQRRTRVQVFKRRARAARHDCFSDCTTRIST